MCTKRIYDSLFYICTVGLLQKNRLFLYIIDILDTGAGDARKWNAKALRFRG